MEVPSSRGHSPLVEDALPGDYPATYSMKPASRPGDHLTVAGLFAGIGGIEEGLHQAGHRSVLLCEIDEGACKVLQERFPDVPLTRDVRELETLGRVDVLSAGFPCQDLSQAGKTVGIRGRNSGLIGQVFRLLDSVKRGPRWLLLENVPFMLHLDRGRAMRYLVTELESRGFSWAYRVVDTRAFGLPQRRQRVILLASRSEDPRPVLLAENEEEERPSSDRNLWRGFYWTEGTRGLGWALDGVPTLKGGSSIGIPSPPAIWNPRDQSISTPEIRDVERLQGFKADWTLPALGAEGVRRGHRWKLVGNAVSVPVSKWIGENLARIGRYQATEKDALAGGALWPRAAWGHRGKVFQAEVSMWPTRWPRPHLSEYLDYPVAPLSVRAAEGFLSRARASTLSFELGFLDDVARHIQLARQASAA